MSQTKKASAVVRWLLGFTPLPVAIRWLERFRSCVGALLGIAFTAGSMHVLPGADATIPVLVAPMGASAVLLFGVPASPLAQPWSIIGGNLVSAAVGVSCAIWIADPVDAAALAVALAICAMFALRCVHPPSGAVALTAVLGGPGIHAMGYSFILEPIAVQSFALLTAAIVFHSLTGHRYPHVGTQNPTQGATASMAMPSGFTRGGLEAMLGRRSEWLDIDTDDLQSLLRETQLQGYVRVFSELTCANIMSQPPISVPASMKAEAAQRLLRRHGLKAMLVTDPANQVIGRVALADLARLGGVAKLGVLIHRLWPIVRRSSTSMHVVEAVMTTGLCVTADSTPIADLVPLFANDEHSSIPVLDGSRQLVGLITPTDLISGLYRQAQAAQY